MDLRAESKTPLRLRRDPRASVVATLAAGELAEVTDEGSGPGGRWRRVRTADGRTGWVAPSSAAVDPSGPHVYLAVPRADVFAAPGIESPVVRTLKRGAFVEVLAIEKSRDEAWVRIGLGGSGGWIPGSTRVVRYPIGGEIGLVASVLITAAGVTWLVLQLVTGHIMPVSGIVPVAGAIGVVSSWRWRIASIARRFGTRPGGSRRASQGDKAG
jgi:SH3-like domain-containing protein